MDEMGIDFREGDEHELAFVKAGMRDFELFRRNPLLAEKEEIEIHDAGTPSESRFAAESRFHLLERPEKPKRVPFRFDLDDAVDEQSCSPYPRGRVL